MSRRPASRRGSIGLCRCRKSDVGSRVGRLGANLQRTRGLRSNRRGEGERILITCLRQGMRAGTTVFSSAAVPLFVQPHFIAGGCGLNFGLNTGCVGSLKSTSNQLFRSVAASTLLDCQSSENTLSAAAPAFCLIIMGFLAYSIASESRPIPCNVVAASP